MSFAKFETIWGYSYSHYFDSLGAASNYLDCPVKTVRASSQPKQFKKREQVPFFLKWCVQGLLERYHFSTLPVTFTKSHILENDAPVQAGAPFWHVTLFRNRTFSTRSVIEELDTPRSLTISPPHTTIGQMSGFRGASGRGSPFQRKAKGIGSIPESFGTGLSTWGPWSRHSCTELLISLL